MYIELRGIWFRYNSSSTWILKNIDTIIKSGEIVHVTGVNGSGKTTFMKIASLLYRPTKGCVIVNGIDFWRLNDKKKTDIRKHIVYVHEKPILINGSVKDNIIYGLTIRGISKDKASKIVLEYLKRLDIEELINLPITSLSLGQAQLIAIIRALVVKPHIVFLDEAFSNIDEEKRKLLFELLLELNNDNNMGIIISSHNKNFEMLRINRVLVIEQGIVKEQNIAIV